MRRTITLSFEMKVWQDFTNFISCHPNFFQKAIEINEKEIEEDPKHIFHGEENKMVAMKLNENMIWPTFMEKKQVDNFSSGAGLYFHRYGGVDELRYKMTLDVLKGKSRSRGVCWIGVPGIGKSK
jgi:hypothetical protein